MKRPHFALPEIYDESLSYYDVLRKLIKSMHVISDDLNKIPEQIANEAKARLLGDQNLQQNINTEATAREQADGTLQTNIDNEKQLREQADQEIREGVSVKISELKSDIVNSKKAIAELADKKITKFYANSLGETTLNDSDKGKIHDMKLFGKSVQDGTPTPDSPVEIQSVVNPTIKLCGNNLWDEEVELGYLFYNKENENYGEKAVARNQIRAKNFISVEPNTKYTAVTNGTIFIIQYDENKKGIPDIGNNGYISISKKYSFITDDRTRYICFYFLASYGTVYNGGIIISKNDVTEYEPYKPIQTATLPCTLNALPVSSGGNVTIDGQQYISDYVDIERKKKLVFFKDIIFDGSEAWKLYKPLNNGGISVSLSNPFPNVTEHKFSDTECYYACDKFIYSNIDNANNKLGTYLVHNNLGSNWVVLNVNFTSVDDFKAWANENNIKFLYRLATPTETDLTDEEVQAFKELATYYPTTNVLVTSDQIEGCTTFNYRISLANGWNYVKQQIGDTRDYIYDMDLQSAEAYVNSEYAVTLTELGV